MDAKEVKSLLKQARDAIKGKEYKETLKICKAILKVDKNNYNAWVFVGAAAQEIDQVEQSEAAFKRAIEIAPDQLLAWQGICSFYEKHKKEEYIPELLTTYKKLLELYDSDKEKKIEIYDKLIVCVRSLCDKEKTIKVLKSKLDLIKGDDAQEFIVHKQIFDELCGKVPLTIFEKERLTEAVQVLIMHESFSENDCNRFFSSCIEILYKNGDQNYALSLAIPIHEKFPNNLSCLEFLSRSAMNSYIENQHVVQNLNDICEKMKREEPKGLNAIIQGFCSYVSKNYVDAAELCLKGLETIEYCFQGWYFLSASHLKLHQYKESIKSCKSGIDVCSKLKIADTVVGKFYLLLGQGLCGCQNFDIAINAIEKSIDLIGLNKETLLVLCSTLLKIGLVEKAEKMYLNFRPNLEEDAEVLLFESHVALLKKDFENALKILRKSVALSESSYVLHLIGLVLWESGEREKAYKVFTKAMELDPYLPQNFLYLGHYYQFVVLDKNNAEICYRKAFKLDSFDHEIGLSLSQVLADLGREDENIEVLKVITEQSSIERCKWAWTQLGLYQLQRNMYSEAIHAFQNVVRSDPNSSHAWECLADAYLKRGSYESALKAFKKASEINPKANYPLYQMATIQKIRGFYYEAIEQYKNLLNILSTYIPALIGLAETLILLSKKCFSQCLFGLSKDYSQEALNTLARVASSNTTLSCLWKLAGDACSISFHFDDSWFPLTVPFELSFDADKKDVYCTKSEILSWGSKFYSKAIAIKKIVSTLWHDLGTNYYYQCKTSVIGSEKLDFIKRAFVCFQKAASLSPNYEPHWTALGVVALSDELRDNAFGQHALIKSLHVNSNNAETWSNLGVLYLQQNNLELANAVFKQAQAAEPMYPNSWIGQAFIAEKVGHNETIDLYRHSTTLGSHTEALLGYSRVVCQTLLDASKKNTSFYKWNIEFMNAVVCASDCATKFVANQHKSPEALNMQGLLLERESCYAAAMKAYKRSLDLLQDTDKSDYVEKVRFNYARILCTLGLIDESITEFLLLKIPCMSTLVSSSYTYYKAKKFEQALKLLEQAFKVSNEPGEKSHIKVAMAMVATNIETNVPNPLTLLYESSLLKPASVPGLLALCARGILRDEHNLTLAAQNELRPYAMTKEYSTKIAFLYAAQAFIQKGPTAGRNEFLKYVHCSPNNGTLWLQLSSCLLEWDKKFATVAANCSKIANFHGSSKEKASQLFAMCQISKGYKKAALSAAQQAVHINPGSVSNWITLAASCHVAGKDRRDIGWIFSFVKKLAKDQGGKIKPHLLGALIILEVFHNISTEKISQAEVLISQAEAVSLFSDEIRSTLRILDAVKVFMNSGNLEPIVIAIKNSPKLFFGWHALSQLLLSSESFTEAEKTLSRFAITAEKIFPQWTIFPLLQLATLSYKAMHVSGDHDRWLKLGEEVTGKAVHQAPNNSAARFLQGLFALESGNTNLARRSFEKVLSCSTTKEANWIEEITHKIIEQKNLKRKTKESS